MINKHIRHIHLPVHRIVSCYFKFSSFGLNTKKNSRWYTEIVKFYIGVYQKELQESLV